jgi:penicillin-binding protein 1A
VDKPVNYKPKHPSEFKKRLKNLQKRLMIILCAIKEWLSKFIKHPIKTLTKTFIFFAIILPLLIIAFGFGASHFLSDLPSISDIEFFKSDLTSRVYDKDGRLIGEFFIERRTFVPISHIPQDVKNAFIAIEDDLFYEHFGISPRAVSRAIYKIFNKGSYVEGGSTITQQLARTIFLTSEKTWERKIKEAVMALRIESIYSKDEILETYLNEIYLAAGVYGVQEASLKYFGKPVWELDIAQAALLAAIPKSPTNYNPYVHPQAALDRRNIVLQRMLYLNFITKEQYFEARGTPIEVVEEIRNEQSPFGMYFVEHVRILLSSIYEDRIYRDGFSIYTTLDLQAQKAAETVLENHLSRFDESRNRQERAWRKNKQEQPSQSKVQGALIAIVPQTGEIRAMVGGRDFNESKFNRAVQAKRQPGSAFKPFVYLTAITKGLTPASLFSDRPMTFAYNKSGNKWVLQGSNGRGGNRSYWSPKNSSRGYRGDIILADALAFSVNIVAVEALVAMGIEPIINTAQRLGITSPLVDAPSLALGSSEVTLQELVSAYAVFAAQGIKTQPYVVEKIVDRNGNIVFRNDPPKDRVISEQTSFVMTNLLRNVITRGTGKAARSLGRPAAGKTGTTNDNSDAWFVAFTPELAAGVWVGYDDRSISLGRYADGGRIAAPIWTDFMKRALRGKPSRQFKQPKGIQWASVDAKNGLLASNGTAVARREAFIKGTTPKYYTIRVRTAVYNYGAKPKPKPKPKPKKDDDGEEGEDDDDDDVDDNDKKDNRRVSFYVGRVESSFSILFRARQGGGHNDIPQNLRTLRLSFSRYSPYTLSENSKAHLFRWIMQIGKYRNPEIIIEWQANNRNLQGISHEKFASAIRSFVVLQQRRIQRVIR